ncbi:putative holin-like toxin [Enterococcus sp. DIV0724b]
MCFSAKGECLLSALETIQLILSFGMFTIALIKLMGSCLKAKNNRQL